MNQILADSIMYNEPNVCSVNDIFDYFNRLA